MKKIINSKTVFIIAEAGVNHNGRLKLAKQLVDAAHQAGCDAVKFQIFKAEAVVSREAFLAEYQKKDKSQKVQNQLQLIKNLELSYEDFQELKEYCHQRGIIFMATPFDHDSADFLDQLDVSVFKISSGEVTNIPFLQYIAQKKKMIILSTGMSYLHEVQQAVKAIQAKGNNQLILLHCVTEYPAPFNEINLRVLHTLKETFHLPVGYSDHTLGIEIPIAAAALGAKVIEKHLTLDRNLPGPDHQSSLEPDEFKHMVTAIRHVEQAMGDGMKKPAPCELKNISVVRRSLIAARDIQKGERIQLGDIEIKRPGHGIPPGDLPKIIGKKAKRLIVKDTVLQRGFLN